MIKRLGFFFIIAQLCRYSFLSLGLGFLTCDFQVPSRPLTNLADRRVTVNNLETCIGFLINFNGKLGTNKKPYENSVMFFSVSAGRFKP